MKSLEQRLQRLEDDRSIRDLKSRYLRACDLRRSDTVLDTLDPEKALIDFEGFPPFDNRDDFVTMFTQMGCAPGMFDMHHGANGIIEFVDDNRASGRWSLAFYNINLTRRTLTQMGVEYDDIYVKKDERWYISETRSRHISALVHAVAPDGTSTVTAMGEMTAAFGT